MNLTKSQIELIKALRDEKKVELFKKADVDKFVRAVEGAKNVGEKK